MKQQSWPACTPFHHCSARAGWVTWCWVTWSFNNCNLVQWVAPLKLLNHLSEIPVPESILKTWWILQFFQNLEDTIKVGTVGRTVSKRATSLRKPLLGPRAHRHWEEKWESLWKAVPTCILSHQEQGVWPGGSQGNPVTVVWKPHT